MAITPPPPRPSLLRPLGWTYLLLLRLLSISTCSSLSQQLCRIISTLTDRNLQQNTTHETKPPLTEGNIQHNLFYWTTASTAHGICCTSQVTSTYVHWLNLFKSHMPFIVLSLCNRKCYWHFSNSMGHFLSFFIFGIIFTKWWSLQRNYTAISLWYDHQNNYASLFIEICVCNIILNNAAIFHFHNKQYSL